MLRRPSFSRRLSMESLEARCNPSAGAGLPAAPVVDLQLNPTTEVLAEPVSLNAFAGQTIRLRIAAVNNQGKLIVGVDDATIRPRASAGGGIVDLVVDPRNRDAIGSNFKYVEDPSRSSIGGSGQDVLLGGDARDTLERTSHELGHTLGFRHEHTRPASDAPAAASNLNNDRFADIVTGAPQNGHVKVFDGVTGAEIRSLRPFPGFMGEVFAGAGDGEKIDDIIVAAEPGAGPHVKVIDGTGSGLETVTISGPSTGKFVLTFNGVS